jgi:hypothetical protein
MSRSLLLDTNLLVVFVVGLTDRGEIGKHKRTRDYTPEDFDRLLVEMNKYQELWVTSQSVAECSNLIRQIHSALAERLMQTLSNLVSRINESNMSSRDLFMERCVLTLGVTDAGIAKKSRRVTNLLTADLDLYLEVSQKYGNAINFNHIRTGAWVFGD